MHNRERALYLPIFFAAIISIIPIVYLLFGSVWSTSPGLAGRLTIQNYLEVVKEPGSLGVLLNTIVYSVGAALLSTALAIILAVVVQRTDAPLRRYANFSLLIVLALPWLIEDISWTYLLSPKIGLYNLLISKITGLGPNVLNVFSIWGMIWVMGLSLSPLAYLIISSSLSQIDSRLE